MDRDVSVVATREESLVDMLFMFLLVILGILFRHYGMESMVMVTGLPTLTDFMSLESHCSLESHGFTTCCKDFYLINPLIF